MSSLPEPDPLARRAHRPARFPRPLRRPGQGSRGPTESAAPRRRLRGRLRLPGLLGALAAALVVVVVLAPAISVKLFGEGPAPLVAHAAVTPSRSYAPTALSLVASATGGTGRVTFSWSLNAASLGSGAQVPYVVSVPGVYTFTVVAVDAAGRTSTGVVTTTVLSPYPEANLLIPAAVSDLGPTLTVRWSSTATVSSCLYAGWGSVNIPAFVSCTGDRGAAAAGTGWTGSFATDPDDPEPSPLLFQSAGSGVSVSVGWWYNTTAGTETEGSGSVTTAVAPL